MRWVVKIVKVYFVLEEGMKCFRMIGVVAATLLGFAVSATGQDSSSIEKIAIAAEKLGFPMSVAYEPERNLVVVGCKAYRPAVANMKIIDVTDPQWPTLRGVFKIPTEDETHNIFVAVKGNFAYISADGFGVMAIDISDPVNPVLTDRCENVTRSINRLTLDGNYLYVANHRDGLKIFDISDPSRLVPCSDVAFEYPVEAVAVSENLAVVLGRNFIATLDVRLPTNPQFLGLVRPEEMQFGYGVAINGEYAYVASYSEGIRVIDISDPAHPTQICNERYDREVMDVVAQDSLAFLSVIDGNGGQVMVMNMSNPTDPDFIGLYPNEESMVEACQVSGNLLYVAGFGEGFKILSIEEGFDPILRGELGSFDFWDIDFLDPVKLVIQAEKSVTTYDLTDSHTPTPFASLQTRNYSCRVDTKDGLIAVGSGRYRSWTGNIQLITTSDDSLVEVGTIWLDGSPAELMFKEQYLYAATLSGLTVYIVEDPADPVEVSRVVPHHLTTGMTCTQDFAFLATVGGIFRVDITDPERIFLQDSIQFGSSVASMAAIGDFIFATTESQHLHLLNSANPDTLIDLGVVIDSAVVVLTVKDSLLFTSSKGGCIQMWDISDPLHPGELARYYEALPMNRLKVSDNLLIGLNTERVTVYEFTPVPTLVKPENALPDKFTLLTPFPNPFNSSTTISYTLSKPGWTRMDVMDLDGRLVRRLSQGWMEAGRYQAVWNGGGVGSGTYYLNLEAGGETITKPIVLQK